MLSSGSGGGGSSAAGGGGADACSASEPNLSGVVCWAGALPNRLPRSKPNQFFYSCAVGGPAWAPMRISAAFTCGPSPSKQERR